MYYYYRGIPTEETFDSRAPEVCEILNCSPSRGGNAETEHFGIKEIEKHALVGEGRGGQKKIKL